MLPPPLRERLERALGLPIGECLGGGSYGAAFRSEPPWVVKVTTDTREAKTWQAWSALPHERFPALPVVATVRELRWDPPEPYGGLWVIVREEARAVSAPHRAELSDRQRQLMAEYERHLYAVRGASLELRWAIGAVQDPIVSTSALTPEQATHEYLEALRPLAARAAEYGDEELGAFAETLCALAEYDPLLLPMDVIRGNLGFRMYPELGPPALMVIDPSLGWAPVPVTDTLTANASLHENPPLWADRLRKILKQYGPEVTLLTMFMGSHYRLFTGTLQQEMSDIGRWAFLTPAQVTDPAAVREAILAIPTAAMFHLAENEALLGWLAKEINRTLKAVRQGQGLAAASQCLNAMTLTQVRDWMEAERPDIMSMTACQVMAAEGEWHAALRERAAEERSRAAVPGEVVYAWDDGWRIESLTTRAQIRGEGCALGHCVGGDAYWQMVQASEAEFYSLRDADGQPRQTIQVSTDERRTRYDVVQVKGWGNRRPGEQGRGFDPTECGRLRGWFESMYDLGMETADVATCFMVGVEALPGDFPADAAIGEVTDTLLANPRGGYQWAYHGTRADKLPAIAREGLRPLYGRSGEEVVFFSPDTYTASLHGGGVESDVPFPSGVLLRFPFPRDAVDLDAATGETAFTSRKTVPPHLIDVYPEAVRPEEDATDDGLWMPIQRGIPIIAAQQLDLGGRFHPTTARILDDVAARGWHIEVRETDHWNRSIYLLDEKGDKHGEVRIVDLAPVCKFNVWSVYSSDAVSGFGPLLYDVAMELVSQMGSWLTSDRGTVSRQAQRIWRTYATERPDVWTTELPERCRIQRRDPFVRRKFRLPSQDRWAYGRLGFRKQVTTLPELEARNLVRYVRW